MPDSLMRPQHAADLPVMPDDQAAAGALDQLARRLADLFQPVTIALAELGPLLGEVTPARVVPSDRFAVGTVTVRDTPGGVLGGQLDRARVTFYNSGTVTVFLGRDGSLTATSSARFPLPAGASLTIDTRAGWVAVTATGQTGELAYIAEEYDPR